MYSNHFPVLLNEVIKGLVTNTSGIYIDCTLGFGGHSGAILNKLDKKGFLIGLDLDSHALDEAKEKLHDINNKRFSLHHSSYKEFPKILSDLSIEKVDGFLFDLGISSYQIDSEHRGFSYSKEGPLNMRFNEYDKQTAKEYLEKITEFELANIIRIYAEIGNSKKIAREIVKRRNDNKMHTTLDLKKAISKALNNNSNKILSRVFQAIRIGVNDEIQSFKNILKVAPEFLKNGGRIAVISFHSIEDRIVKHFFKNSVIIDEADYYKKDLIKSNAKLKIITKKPIIATKKEILLNKRSRSAKLRIAEL